MSAPRRFRGYRNILGDGQMKIRLRERQHQIWIILSCSWALFVYLAAPQMQQFTGFDFVRFITFIIVPSLIMYLTFLLANWAWDRIGERHWLAIPMNVRRGILRLYFVVTLPWVSWFGYKICDFVLNHPYWHWYNISKTFWSLLIVLVGGPILLSSVLWVIAGFREAVPSVGEKRNSKLEGRTLRPTSHENQTTIKTTSDYAGIGKVLGKIFVKPKVWRDINRLRGYQVPESVANYEVAFARVAIIRETIRQQKTDVIATQILGGVDQYIIETFTHECEQEVLDHYKQVPLYVVASRAIRSYESNVFPLTELALILSHRLSIVSLPATEIAALFDEVKAEAETLMNIHAEAEALMNMLRFTTRFQR